MPLDFKITNRAELKHAVLIAVLTAVHYAAVDCNLSHVRALEELLGLLTECAQRASDAGVMDDVKYFTRMAIFILDKTRTAQAAYRRGVGIL